MISEIILILFLIILNGILAMSEIAIVSARSVRLQKRITRGDRGARVAIDLAGNPNRFLSTVQIGITLVGILAGALGARTVSDNLAGILGRSQPLAPYSEVLAFILVVGLTTFFSLVIGELVPKRLGLSHPEKIASRIAIPMRFLSRIAAPLVYILSASTEVILKLLRTGSSGETEPSVTEEEIKILIEQGTKLGIFNKAEQEMVESVFRLSDRPASAFMTPRTNVAWLDINDRFETNWEKIKGTEYSYFPVCNRQLDNLAGVLSVRQIWQKVREGKPFQIADMVQPPLFVPETVTALRVIDLFKKHTTHFAITVDEYGSISGIITLVDILSSISGEIPNAPAGSLGATRREDGSWLLDGSITIDELKKHLHLETLSFRENISFHTLGGLMMSKLGHIPLEGQRVDAAGYRFEVIDMDGNRVDKVLATPLAKNS